MPSRDTHSLNWLFWDSVSARLTTASNRLRRSCPLRPFTDTLVQQAMFLQKNVQQIAESHRKSLNPCSWVLGRASPGALPAPKPPVALSDCVSHVLFARLDPTLSKIASTGQTFNLKREPRSTEGFGQGDAPPSTTSFQSGTTPYR